MSGLVGYGSSDEDDEVEERPSKIAKIDNTQAGAGDERNGTQADHRHEGIPAQHRYPGLPAIKAPSQPVQASHGPAAQSNAPDIALATAEDAVPGPAALVPPENTEPTSTTTSPPASPYTANRTLLHNLTMPTHPNFSIPSSPALPSSPDSKADLAATTKKFNRFLDLKRKGVHFNARLNESISLRNPSLLPKLMEFAGVSEEDSRVSTLSEEAGAVPVVWKEESYVENLVRENERWKMKRLKERSSVEFVGARADGGNKTGS